MIQIEYRRPVGNLFAAVANMRAAGDAVKHIYNTSNLINTVLILNEKMYYISFTRTTTSTRSIVVPWGGGGKSD
jgi:hypothetical protein